MNTIAVNVNSEAGMKKQKNGNANLQIFQTEKNVMLFLKYYDFIVKQSR